MAEERKDLAINEEVGAESYEDSENKAEEILAPIPKAPTSIVQEPGPKEKVSSYAEAIDRTKSKFIGFSGRLARKEYFIHLLKLLPLLILEVILVSTGVGSMIAFPLAIFTTVVQVGLMIRRIHDIGWSGWLALISLIPIVSLIFGIVLLFKPGQPHTNAYGAPRV